MGVGLLHDTQVQKSPVSFSFLAPIYQAWKEIPSIVFEDLSAIWGPTDQRVSCTIQRSGALFSRTPWALLRDSLSVILVPRDSGTTESRLSPRVFTPHPCEQSWAPPTTTLIPRLFAETATLLLYPGTVDSPSSTQDNSLTPLPFQDHPGYFLCPLPHGSKHKTSLPAKSPG